MSINWRKLREVDPPTDGTKVVFCDVYGNFLSGTFRLNASTAPEVIAKPGLVDMVVVAGTWDIISPNGSVEYFYDCNNSEDLAKINDIVWWCLASDLGVPTNMEDADGQDK